MKTVTTLLSVALLSGCAAQATATSTQPPKEIYLAELQRFAPTDTDAAAERIQQLCHLNSEEAVEMIFRHMTAGIPANSRRRFAIETLLGIPVYCGPASAEVWTAAYTDSRVESAIDWPESVTHLKP